MHFSFVFTFLKDHRFWSWLLGLGAAACLLPFLALAAYCHPYLDDYSVPIALREEGFMPYVINTHFRHSGRFSSSMISVLHPFVAAGGISLFLYRLYISGLILLLGVSIWVTTYTILGGGSLPRWVRHAGGSLLIVCFFLWLPSPTEAFYWFISGLAYTVPCILGLCLLAVISALQHPLPSSLRGILWVAGWLLAFFAPAFSEVTACITMAGALVFMPLLWGKKGMSGWWMLICLATLSAILLLTAPGNFSRMHHMGTVIAPAHAVFTTTLTVVYTLTNWLGSGILVLVTILVLPWLHMVAATKAAPRWQRLTQQPWVWPLFFGMSIYSSYLLTYLAIDAPPFLRCLNILYLFFILCWWMSVFGFVCYRARQGYAAPLLSGPTQLLVGALTLVSFWSTHDVPLERLHIDRRINMVVSAYSDWLSGDAARFDQEQQARFRLLTSPEKDVILPPLTVKLRVIYYNDLSTDPRWWGNQNFAACFAKRSLRVDATTPTPSR